MATPTDEDVIYQNLSINARRLLRDVYVLYQKFHDSVPFHDWEHIWFVFHETHRFAKRNGADIELSIAAALVHDLNHLAEPGSTSAAAGSDLRRQLLHTAGYSQDFIQRVEHIVLEAETSQRSDRTPSIEGQALSDADTLYKVLPDTVNKSARYTDETGVHIIELARKIVGEQSPLVEKKIYLYDEQARSDYKVWIERNLEHWRFLLAEYKESEIYRDHVDRSRVPPLAIDEDDLVLDAARSKITSSPTPDDHYAGAHAVAVTTGPIRLPKRRPSAVARPQPSHG